MRLSIGNTARLAITAGLCVSMTFGAVPVVAIAQEAEQQVTPAPDSLSADGVQPSAPAVPEEGQKDEIDQREDVVDAYASGAAEAPRVDDADASIDTPAPSNDESASTQLPELSPAGSGSTQAEAAPGQDTDRGQSPVTMVQEGGQQAQYATISEALSHVADYDYKTNKGLYTITLSQDMAEDVVISANKNVKIDLAGHTLTNVKSHTILNRSTRATVTDSSEGSGVVDNVTHGKAAIYNDINSTITLSGGSFTRSQEQSASDSNAGGNSYYVIKNYGTMTIEGNAVVKFSASNPGLFSSLVANGWQDAASAEAGTNGEPKPSAGKKKATLTIKGGRFIGGQITVKNDDYGTLNIKGGTIEQPSAGRFAVHNNHIADISGGCITSVDGAVASRAIAGEANKGTISISKDVVISSEQGSPLTLTGGAKATVKGGTFEAASGAVAISIVDADSSALVTAGTFKGSAQVSNREDVFGEGMGPITDTDGSLVVGVTNAAATVVLPDGTSTEYATLSEAFDNVPSASKIVLQRDVVLTKGVSTGSRKVYGITLDLNGHDIDGAAVKSSRGVVYLNMKYGTKPPQGADLTMRVVNSVSGKGGSITGKLPLGVDCGDSNFEVPLLIGEGVKLVGTDAGANLVKLSGKSYLRYDERASEYFRQGGFKVTAADGERVYNEYGSAVGASAAADRVVTLLNDIETNEAIAAGKNSGTLDLAGHTYTYTSNQQAIQLNYANTRLTIKNGVVSSTSDKLTQGGATLLHDGASLVLDHATLSIKADAYGIATNGTSRGCHVTLRNSTLDAPNGFGIYFPSSGAVDIENSVINAKHCGVQLCAGDLRVSGKDTEITVTGMPQSKVEDDGGINDGAAISIVNRQGYQGIGSVAISGGTFVSTPDAPTVKAYSFSNADKTEAEWPKAPDVIDISGGSFETHIDESYLADGFGLKQNEDGSYGVHRHIGKKVEATDATCETDGNRVHWICSECGKMFDDEAMTNEVKPEDVKIPATGHRVADAIHHESSAPTETTVGNREYWECPDCHKLFLDAALTQETSIDEVTIPALGVTKVIVTFVERNGVTYTQEVKPGSKLARPKTPELDGWKFVGWFKVKTSDGVLSDEWDFDNDIVTSDVTLYGGWVKDVQNPEGQPGDPSAKPEGQPVDPSKNPGPGLAQTGDASIAPVALASMAGLVALGGGAVARKRRRSE